MRTSPPPSARGGGGTPKAPTPRQATPRQNATPKGTPRKRSILGASTDRLVSDGGSSGGMGHLEGGALEGDGGRAAEAAPSEAPDLAQEGAAEVAAPPSAAMVADAPKPDAPAAPKADNKGGGQNGHGGHGGHAHGGPFGWLSRFASHKRLHESADVQL